MNRKLQKKNVNNNKTTTTTTTAATLTANRMFREIYLLILSCP